MEDMVWLLQVKLDLVDFKYLFSFKFESLLVSK